jgi:CubicO group peptidase (beta-lactamase class C family)
LQPSAVATTQTTDDDVATATDVTTTEAAQTVTTSDPPTTAAPTTDPPEPPPTTTEEAPDPNIELAAQIEEMLTEALAPGSIRWDRFGVDVPPTAMVAAVRVPGRDDVVVAVGENIDGTPVDADAPFGLAHLATSLVKTVAFQLIDEGVLDPARTVDEWVPALPNADRVTVQMLIDDATGWGDYDYDSIQPVVSDFARAWSLRESVELLATSTPALDEPGTRTDDNFTNEHVLGLVVEEVGGQPLADLVRDRVAGPAGTRRHRPGRHQRIPGRLSARRLRVRAGHRSTRPSSTRRRISRGNRPRTRRCRRRPTCSTSSTRGRAVSCSPPTGPPHHSGT